MVQHLHQSPAPSILAAWCSKSSSGKKLWVCGVGRGERKALGSFCLSCACVMVWLAQSKWTSTPVEIPFTSRMGVSFSHVFEEASPVCLTFVNLGPQKWSVTVESRAWPPGVSHQRPHQGNHPPAGEDAALSVWQSSGSENKGRTLRMRRLHPLNMPSLASPALLLEICFSSALIPSDLGLGILIPGWTEIARVSRGAAVRIFHQELRAQRPESPGGPTFGACHPPSRSSSRASVPAKPRASREGCQGCWAPTGS